MTLIAIFIALIFGYSLVSRRVEQSVLTAPILFTGAGMLVFIAAPGMQDWKLDRDWFLVAAEAGLVLLLYTDASRTELQFLRRIQNLSVRLLSAGMLLTIVLGALCARLLFPRLTWWEAGILSAILAPTDAGLGQIIVNSPRVPVRIRQALNVEAGLNDGLSVPFLLFFIALAGTAVQNHGATLAQFMMEQLGYGAGIGVGIGLVGGWLLGMARRREWIAESFLQLGVVTLPLFCGVISEVAGASMFIAAFVAGLAVQVGFKEAGKHSVEFTEQWGQILNLSVFFLFGIVVVRNWQSFDASLVVYAILSLTVVRMLPVALSLIGTRLNWTTVLFMGWFGPRGLASIVLGLVYLEREAHQPGERTIASAVMVTVLISIFAHGLSAMPGIALYARRITALSPDAPEYLSAGPRDATPRPAAPIGPQRYS